MNDEAMIDEDVLLHRAVSRIATRSDWSALERTAVTDPGIWKRLADVLRDECAVAASFAPALDAAAVVELPSPVESLPMARSSSHAGWLAAAALLLCWISTLLAMAPGRFEGGARTAISHLSDAPAVAPAVRGANTATATDVVSELPKLVVEARNVEGGVEITYLRRIFERTRVDQVVRYAENEAGQPTLVPAAHTLPRTYEDF